MSKVKRKANLVEALIPIFCLILFLGVAVFNFKASPHIPLIAGAIVAALMASIRLGYSWGELEEGVLKTINMAMQAILILMIVGTIVGTWILSGVVPTMIYYGLKILSPGIFLVATCIICSIVALATGSSWTTAGTVGIALIGVGQGLGIPNYIVAGAIISGAYFGDKMSPLSDTTNLAPAMAGTNLFDHVKHMVFTTGPSLLIALIIYGFIGIKYAGKNLDPSSINQILTALSSNFNINLLLFIPPILVIAMVVMKVPAIPGLIGGSVVGGLFAAIFQKSSIGDIINAAHYGFTSETGVEAVDNLLSRGGLDGMMWTVSLILCALTLGGILEKTGMLEVIAESILKLARGTGGLVVATIFSCIFVNLVTGEQYLSIVIPGRMYKDAYRKKGLHPKNLSRALEDSGTLTSPLIPWNTCGAYMFATLGVNPLAYLPFAFMNLINPLVSIFYGFTGITMEKLPPEEMLKDDLVIE
ncbi:Na+/H+ antiporter NhaC [Tepidibacter formicigenes]|jgi:NhaC family Na+:H+ antiporter|uniref:Na+:H+ antiporter, NhaC family n=1 Tax=Tepidibacter formicigenes DSM 15518 TaxID=1123349 RepID=A0A1M6Q9Y1_9FIRM|nr:Na+/H+ antiporter NhaC [Tepidibacter formicigenes]SHK16991.1 Na+:H+ antiporter, NhaC family [Tepidibacter formicigenes DSM 15518]